MRDFVINLFENCRYVMDYLLIWLTFVLIQFGLAISPGPAFAICVRNAIVHNRMAGIGTALGLGFGVAVHSALSILGLSVLINAFPPLFYAIKYVGAFYLVYIGIKGILAKKRSQDTQIDPAQNPQKPFHSFVITGFATNILNPKAWILIPAFLAQFVTLSTPWFMKLAFGVTMPMVELTWFTILTLFLTHAPIRKQFIRFSHWIDRICGGLLITLGIKILLDKSLKLA